MHGSSITTRIAVVGGGPAGARVAELLSAAGADILLLDPRAPWEKPCGGGLTESAFRDVPELREVAHASRTVRRIRVETDPSHGLTVSLAVPIRVLSRTVLARWQLDRARDAGAVHLAERVRSIRRGGAGWILETDARTIRAEHLVGADGAASLVRRVTTPKFRVELAPTRVGFAPGAGPTPDTILVRFFPRVAGYVWDFPRPDHRSVGIGLPAGTWRRPRMDDEVERFRHSTEACVCLEGEIRRAGAVIGTAQLGHGDFSRIAGRGFALLGDAAGLADPATGEGIRNALRSAQLLADAWGEHGTFEGYPTLARKAFEREFNVSRLLRRIMFESEVGMQLIAAGLRSDAAYAVISTLADAVNEHDGSPRSLAGRWWRALRWVRESPEGASRGTRSPAPCACGKAEEEATPPTVGSACGAVAGGTVA